MEKEKRKLFAQGVCLVLQDTQDSHDNKHPIALSVCTCQSRAGSCPDGMGDYMSQPYETMHTSIADSAL